MPPESYPCTWVLSDPLLGLILISVWWPTKATSSRLHIFIGVVFLPIWRFIMFIFIQDSSIICSLPFLLWNCFSEMFAFCCFLNHDDNKAWLSYPNYKDFVSGAKSILMFYTIQNPKSTLLILRPVSELYPKKKKKRPVSEIVYSEFSAKE